MALKTLSPKLDQRLRHRLHNALIVYADYIGDKTLTAQMGTGLSTMELLLKLLELAAKKRDDALTWLIYATLIGVYPTEADFRGLQRALRRGAVPQALVSLMQHNASSFRKHLTDEMLIVTDVPIVVIDGTTGKEHLGETGGVVRHTVPRWLAQHRLIPARWNDEQSALQLLTPAEYHHLTSEVKLNEAATPPLAQEPTLLIPFQTELIFADIPINNYQTANRVATLSNFAKVPQNHIVYDFLPITSADLRPWQEPSNTTAQFSTLKYAQRVAAISAATESEVTGFVNTLPSQGLTGPQVRTIPIPAIPDSKQDPPHGWRPANPIPIVLGLGTLEKHKNPRRVLHAVEILWRRGLKFEFRQVGDVGHIDNNYLAACERLQAEGFPITKLGRLSQRDLQREYGAADVAVFTSLQEGVGLPIVEALHMGTPVVTSNYGSQAEIAQQLGGCLTVDPYDDVAIANAIQKLLEHPQIGAQLLAEYQAKARRTWDDYARETWDYLTSAHYQEATS